MGHTAISFISSIDFPQRAGSAGNFTATVVAFNRHFMILIFFSFLKRFCVVMYDVAMGILGEGWEGY